MHAPSEENQNRGDVEATWKQETLGKGSKGASLPTLSGSQLVCDLGPCHRKEEDNGEHGGVGNEGGKSREGKR